MAKYEYLLHTWGGFFNDEHRAKHGQRPGYFWFDTIHERQSYLDHLRGLEVSHGARCLAVAMEKGEHTRLRTVAEMTFVFYDNRFPYRMDFGYGVNPDNARYMFEEGNYSCDCNRSLFIGREVQPGFPELPCGENIDMVDFRVLQVQGTDSDHEFTDD